MRRSRLPLLILATLVPPCLGAQRAFDGVIAYQVTGMADQPVQLVYMAKGSKVRQEIVIAGMPLFDGGVQLFDYARGQMLSLMPSRRQYTTANFRSARADAPSGGGTAIRVEPTGKRETIAGTACEVYEVGGEDEVCVATTLGHFIAIEGQAGIVAMGQGGGNENWYDPRFAAFLRYFKDGGVPLRFTLDRRGRRPMTFTATRVERKSLADDLFRVPAGYTPIGP